MDQEQYIKKLAAMQRYYLFNLQELAAFFCVATNTIRKFRKKDPMMHWATLKNFKDRIDQWEKEHGK